MRILDIPSVSKNRMIYPITKIDSSGCVSLLIGLTSTVFMSLALSGLYVWIFLR